MYPASAGEDAAYFPVLQKILAASLWRREWQGKGSRRTEAIAWLCVVESVQMNPGL